MLVIHFLNQSISHAPFTPQKIDEATACSFSLSPLQLPTSRDNRSGAWTHPSAGVMNDGLKKLKKDGCLKPITAAPRTKSGKAVVTDIATLSMIPGCSGVVDELEEDAETVTRERDAAF